VLIACPDARPPAYEAAAGLAQAGLLGRFLTATYYGGTGVLARSGRRLAPDRFGRWERLLKRRHHPGIPADRVTARPGVDLALAAESRLATRWPAARRAIARARTQRFDLALARALDRDRPDVAFLFSDVGSEHALPACRRLGIRSVLSMVHGDVREEREVLEREAGRSPDFFPIYLGDGALDLGELDWLHRRRLRDIALADRILVPSEHIAATLARHGTPRERVAVVPYAADTSRFVPDPDKVHGPSCTFLFAGGITQRKGIKYLLQGLATHPTTGLAAPATRGPAARPRPAGALSRRGRAPGPGRPRRGPRPDGRGRRVRLPFAVRGLGGRHL
jgi:glycosyltransferase involved in cell wall biosynthesis